MGSPLGGYGGKLGWSAGLGSWLDSPSSKVKRYWREIEYGSGGDWSGRTVAGLWGDSLGNGPLAGDPFNPGARTQKFKPAFRKGTKQTPEGMLGAARYALWVYMKGETGGKRDWIEGHMDRLDVRYVWVYKRQTVDGRRSVVRGSGERRAPRTEAEYRRAQQSLFHFFMTKASIDQIPFVAGVIMKPIPARHYYATAIADFKPRLIEMELEGMRKAAYFALQGKEGGEFRTFRAKGAEENDTRPRAGRARREQPSLGTKYTPTGGAVVTITASAQVQFSMRNANGRFVNGAFQSTLREVNARVAAAYLREVARLMETHRPSTGDLIKATLDSRNRYPDDKFKV